MLTKEQLIEQCKSDNPTMTCTINGEAFVLSKFKYDKAAQDWAVMRLAQIEFEAKEKIVPDAN